MTKAKSAVTYSPYTRKFYEGSWDKDDTDFRKDQGLTAIARLNIDRNLGDGRIAPIDIETFRQAERAYKQGNIDST